MPLPWDSFREHVERAIGNIYVSHRPDHGHEGAMHNDTAYGLLADGQVRVHKIVDGRREEIKENLKVIQFSCPKAIGRHGIAADGSPRPYKGYKGDSNYCIEISKHKDGKWVGDVISTFDAYQIVREYGLNRLRHPKFARNGQILIMRLMVNDVLRLHHDDRVRAMRVVKISSNGQIFMAEHHEANVDSRNRDKADAFSYISKTANTLKSARARSIFISPIGEIADPGFRG
jgi:CRISPR-associated endonuclease Csn1